MSTTTTGTHSTVLIRLAAPMQSWGTKPRGAHRSSGPRPTKSGVIGLVANAMGRDYTDSIDDLAALTFGVRVDRPGNIEVDYHTTGSGSFPLLPGNVLANAGWRRKANTRDPRDEDFYSYAPPINVSRDKTGELTAAAGNTNQTRDRYLADAAFLVSLTGPTETVTAVADAMQSPARAVFLGRKAYTPSTALFAGHTNTASSETALAAAPRYERSIAGPLNAWVEVAPGTTGSAVVHDQPISFAHTGRRGARAETRITVAPPERTPETVHPGDYDFFQEAPQ